MYADTERHTVQCPANPALQKEVMTAATPSAAVPTHADVKQHHAQLLVNQPPRREVMTSTSPVKDNSHNKLLQAPFLAETALSEQKQSNKRGCCVLCLTAPPTEQILDSVGGPSQEEQRQVFQCFDRDFPRNTTISVSTLLSVLKEVLPAYW